MNDPRQAFAALIASVPLGFRWLFLTLLAIIGLGFVLWIVVAFQGLAGMTSLIASGLLLTGLLVTLIGGVLGSFRQPDSMLWTGLALTIFALLFSLPWADYFSSLNLPQPQTTPSEVMQQDVETATQTPAIISALTDRTKSSIGISALDLWLVFVVLVNLLVLALIAEGRKKPSFIVQVNAVSTFLLFGIGMVLVHLWA